MIKDLVNIIRRTENNLKYETLQMLKTITEEAKKKDREIAALKRKVT